MVWKQNIGGDAKDFRIEKITIRILKLLAYNAEKAMAPHASTVAWNIPWMNEPGGLQSMGSLRVRHN